MRYTRVRHRSYCLTEVEAAELLVNTQTAMSEWIYMNDTNKEDDG